MKPANFISTFLKRFDSWSAIEEKATQSIEKIDWGRILPFIGLHLACLLAFWVGVSPIAIGVCIGLYVLRMFAITAFYHRYFSHRTFKTSRFFQFFFAVLGSSAVQRGPIWWSSHHRHHHQYSDQPEDVHSPRQKGFFWSHMNWFLSRKHFQVNYQFVKDWMRFPELKFLDRFDIFIPILLAVILFFTGMGLEAWAPHLHTNGPQLLVWGFFISTVLVAHATFCINSMAHKMGKPRFVTGDDSKNSFILAILTLGEGWHNNHHHYPNSTRQGFYWWEVDFSYYGLKMLQWMGIVWDLKPVPKEVKTKELVTQ